MAKNIESRLQELEKESFRHNVRPAVHLIPRWPYQAYGQSFNSTDELLACEGTIFGPERGKVLFLFIPEKGYTFPKPHAP